MQNENLKVYLEILIINHPPKKKLHKLLATEENTFRVYSSKGHVLFLTQDTSWENGSVNGSIFSLFVYPVLKESRRPSNGDDTERSTKAADIS